MKDRIAEFIREKAYKPMTFEELADALGFGERQRDALERTLAQMESAGEIVRTRTERYGAPERMNLAVGRLQGHPKGFGFLIPDAAGSEDIFIGREGLNGAWHNDRIIARLSPPTRADGRMEGEVIRILTRANQRVVGTFEAARNMGYVTPDDRRLTADIYVPKGATNGAKHGEKVVVQVVQWGDGRRNAEGRIVERIGMKGDVGVDILSVIRKHGLPEAFPPRVLADADLVPEEVTQEAIEEPGRVDLRNWTIVTIDGEDAKDLDDAVNVEQLGDGRWRLGVHIADVSYYVQEGSALDQEAYKRGTSVYLADRVVPMLPPRLSNGVCSLNPHVDRLTLSCVMEINRDGTVVKYDLFPSVIRTTARMTYTKVNQILEGDPQSIEEYRQLVPMFLEMRALQDVLKRKRDRRGALDFDLPEAKVKLNEQGWPVEIRRIDRGIAERVIEEFMLAANETVAEHLLRYEAPVLYRVHEEPAADKLATLKDFLALFGYPFRLPRDAKVTPKMLQEITHWAQGRTEQNLINHVLLRTMKQAVYEERSLGHFGLAADYYCHFTSPIRRYPDLVVHRSLRALMAGELVGRLRGRWEKKMPEMGSHTSERERAAMEAERETVELKKAEYMSDKVGETFQGVISGVTQFGFFVQLPNTVEGLVHVSTLNDDYYHFHDRIFALMGERTRRRFRLGDPVTVFLRNVDVETHQVDFVLDEEQTERIQIPRPEGQGRNRAEKKRLQLSPPTGRESGHDDRNRDRNDKRRRNERGTKIEAGWSGELTGDPALDGMALDLAEEALNLSPLPQTDLPGTEEEYVVREPEFEQNDRRRPGRPERRNGPDPSVESFESTMELAFEEPGGVTKLPGERLSGQRYQQERRPRGHRAEAPVLERGPREEAPVRERGMRVEPLTERPQRAGLPPRERGMRGEPVMERPMRVEPMAERPMRTEAPLRERGMRGEPAIDRPVRAEIRSERPLRAEEPLRERGRRDFPQAEVGGRGEAMTDRRRRNQAPLEERTPGYVDRSRQGGAPIGRRNEVQRERPGALPEPPAWRRRTEPELPVLTHRQAARVSRAVDMWGIPVPAGRVRPADEVGDPSVIAPFALTVGRNDRGGKSKLQLTNWDETATPGTAEIVESLSPAAAPVTEQEELSATEGRPPKRRRRWGRRRSGNRGGGGEGPAAE
ncbi:MAG TPA: ribonuclease R [Symbiobacteriaceae bacterium]|nr:ribonuclease R [Symbiobacteriaceae bacterium]